MKIEMAGKMLRVTEERVSVFDSEKMNEDVTQR